MMPARSGRPVLSFVYRMPPVHTVIILILLILHYCLYLKFILRWNDRIGATRTKSMRWHDKTSQVSSCGIYYKSIPDINIIVWYSVLYDRIEKQLAVYTVLNTTATVLEVMQSSTVIAFANVLFEVLLCWVPRTWHIVASCRINMNSIMRIISCSSVELLS